MIVAAMQVLLGGVALLVLGVGAQLSDDLSREQLKPLTAFRQQHRRLVRCLIQVTDSWV